jgi:hypothetical protein
MKITHRKDLSGVVVSRFQARAALHLAGLLAMVEAAMQGEGVDPLVKLAWTDADAFKRSSPAVLGMAAAFGWSDDLLDQLFVTAQGIEV